MSIFMMVFCVITSCNQYNFDVSIDPSDLNSDALSQAPWRIINLQVDAYELYTSSDNFKKPFVLNNCVISHNENNKTATGPGIINFESIVDIDKTVVWSISVMPTDENIGYIANITQIQTKNSNAPNLPKFFNKQILGSNTNGQVVRKVRNDKSLDGKKQSYEIMFSVQPPGGGDPLYFVVDPKLQAKSTF